MKTFVFALGATLLLSTSAFAQGAGADQAPAAGNGAAKPKEIIQACRTEAKSKGLKGREMRQAVMDCAVKQRPAMAGRLKCRMEGMDQGKTGDDLKTFVKSCMKTSG